MASTAAPMPPEIEHYYGEFVNYVRHGGRWPDSDTDVARSSASLSKLARFSQSHLVELSMDIYDELARRRNPNTRAGQHLAPRSDIHPKRNHARYQIGELSDIRFGDMCLDLIAEQERRWPQLASEAHSKPLSLSLEPQVDSGRRKSSDAYTLPSPTDHSNAGTPHSPSNSHLSDPQSYHESQLQVQSVSVANVAPTVSQMIEDDSDNAYDAEDFNDSELSESDDPHSKQISDKSERKDTESDKRLSIVSVKSKINNGPSDRDTKHSTAWDSEPDSAQEATTYGNNNERDANNYDTGATESQLHEKHILRSSGHDHENAAAEEVEQQIDSSEESDYGDQSLQAECQSPGVLEQARLRRGSNECNAENEMQRVESDSKSQSLMHNAAQAARQAFGPVESNNDSESSIGERPSDEVESNMNRKDSGHESPNAMQDKDFVGSQDFANLLAKCEAQDAQIAHLEQQLRELEASLYREQQQTLELEAQLVEQRGVTEKVKQEASLFLDEMRQLTHQENALGIATVTAEDHAAELKSWKDRYEAAQSELKTMKAIVIPQMLGKDSYNNILNSTLLTTTGLVTEQNYTSFLHNMSDLLQGVRTDPSKALELLHNLVISTRKVTKDASGGESIREELALISRTANHLISVVRNFSVSRGLLAVVVVDAAASDLNFAVVELLRVVGLRGDPQTSRENTQRHSQLLQTSPSSRKIAISREVTELSKSANPKEFVEETPMLQPSGVAESLERAQSDIEDVREIKQPDALQSLSEPQVGKPVLGNDSQENDSVELDAKTKASSERRAAEIPIDSSIQELQAYLEEQTSGTVEAIGSLLSGIRDHSTAGELKPHIGSIVASVNKMIDATGGSMTQSRNWLLKDKGAFILQNLRDCLERMDALQGDLVQTRNDTQPNRQLKQRLAGVSFDMAKSTKELVKTVEEVSLNDEISHLNVQLGRATV